MCAVRGVLYCLIFLSNERLPLSKTLLRHHDFVFRLLSVFIVSFKKDLSVQDNFFSILFLRNDVVIRLGRDDISLTQM